MKDWLLGFKVSLGEGGGIMWVYMYHRSGSEGCTIGRGESFQSAFVRILVGLCFDDLCVRYFWAYIYLFFHYPWNGPFIWRKSCFKLHLPPPPCHQVYILPIVSKVMVIKLISCYYFQPLCVVQ